MLQILSLNPSRPQIRNKSSVDSLQPVLAYNPVYIPHISPKSLNFTWGISWELFTEPLAILKNIEEHNYFYSRTSA